MREKYSRKCYKKSLLMIDSKALKTLDFSDLLFSLHSCMKCIEIFSLQAMVMLEH